MILLLAAGVSDIALMFKNTGFQRSEIQAIPKSKQHLLVSYK